MTLLALVLLAAPTQPPVIVPADPPVRVPAPALLPPQPPPVPGPFAQPVAPTPRWNTFAQPPAWYPGPAAPPFGRLPRVCHVEATPCHEHPPAGGGLAVAPLWVKEFPQAAHFPLPRFDQSGGPMPGDGLLIYEGMRVVVDPTTGVYEVSFTATVPAMPVTVRLQLVFERFPDDPAPYRLTLPPIRLEPRAEARLDDPAAYSFHVAHRGHWSLFAQADPVTVNAPVAPGPLVPPPVTVDAGWLLSRCGAARFGSVVPSTDPSR